MKIFETSITWFVILLLIVSSACQDTSTQKGPPQGVPGELVDPHSSAEKGGAVVTHLELDISLDFTQKIISGSATLTIDNPQSKPYLYLDTKDLTVTGVVLLSTSQKSTTATYDWLPEDSILGRPLVISLASDTRAVSIQYKTSPTAEALQWLEPGLTAGKLHPFLLTQSQAINARTWIPIQDSPGIRFTYAAKVKVPPALMALMSAENPTEKSPEGTYTFKMKQPIPAYLLALAVGDLAFKEVGPRTGVYADPSVLNAAVYEFGEMEEMMTIAEGLYGPYAWERYDVVVLPPSFPFGGMENPRLTFATPTVIAGDRSLVSLIAHELAHSWSGNFVTNATWDDFWVNEGFTVYFENRIMEALKGREYSEMLALISYQDLVEEVKDLDKKDTHLKLGLHGRHPDDGMTSIAYDKGYYFLRLIEETVGREVFDAFLKAYFTENAFKVMDTERFLERLDRELLKDRPALKAKLDIDLWVYGPGIPANCPKAETPLYSRVEAEFAAWQGGKAPASLSTEGWNSHQWLYFLRSLGDETTPEQMAALDEAFHFTQSGNSEIQCEWYTHAVRHGYEAAYPALESFLTSVGRRKFLMPLYKEMAKTDEGKKMAISIYKQARSTYHPISYMSIDKVLGWEE